MRVSISRTKSQNKFSTAALRNFQRFLPAIFTAFRRSLLLKSARRRLFTSSLCCHAAYTSASTPGSGHQLGAPRGRLEHGARSLAMDRPPIRCVDGRQPLQRYQSRITISYTRTSASDAGPHETGGRETVQRIRRRPTPGG